MLGFGKTRLAFPTLQPGSAGVRCISWMFEILVDALASEHGARLAARRIGPYARSYQIVLAAKTHDDTVASEWKSHAVRSCTVGPSLPASCFRDAGAASAHDNL